MNLKKTYYENLSDKKILIKTLEFIFIVAVKKVFPDAQVVLEHTINNGIYGEIIKNDKLTEHDLNLIEEKMKEIIKADSEIIKHRMKKSDAIELFKINNNTDKIQLLKDLNRDEVYLFEIDGVYDYFYSPMAESTGIVDNFSICYFNGGFVLRHDLLEFLISKEDYEDRKKLMAIFKETKNWLNILKVSEVGSLNEKINNGEIKDLVMVSEALHEKKIAQIADKISEKENIKIVLIAGPTSSGKTTFANRLAVQLRVNGFNPIPISIDDYFVNREETPKDKNGEYDYENINAIDLKLFNDDIGKILNNEEVSVPTYNFKTGKKEWNGRKLKLPEKGILILEGIHALNPILTEHLNDRYKFKVYISALTQLNIDYHNRISTSDVRKIRRIVRDNLSRGHGAEDTLKMWPKVKKGERENIFPYQENSDVMFNSTLVYELCVLKKYALEELRKIDTSSVVFNEARRLISFLELFKDLDDGYVLKNSIMREFIGDSVFYNY